MSTSSDIWVIGRVILELMSLGYGEDHPFGSIPPIPPFSDGDEAYYPAELCRLVQACLAPIPGNRPDVTRLWRDIHLEVGSYVGLGGAAMKDWDRQVGEVLRFKPETDLPFATTV